MCGLYAAEQRCPSLPQYIIKNENLNLCKDINSVPNRMMGQRDCGPVCGKQAVRVYFILPSAMRKGAFEFDVLALDLEKHAGLLLLQCCVQIIFESRYIPSAQICLNRRPIQLLKTRAPLDISYLSRQSSFTQGFVEPHD